MADNTLSTGVQRFRVEHTPRGGHLVRVDCPSEAWVGLYRCDDRLMLLARCQGAPPRRLDLPAEVWNSLRLLLAAPPVVPS